MGTKMKTLFGLTILFLFSSLCHGYCFHRNRKEEEMNIDVTCVDPVDGSTHAAYTEWTNKECMYCRCDDVLACCTSYGGMVRKPGCQAKLNLAKCRYEFFRIDDLSKRCT